jgi:carboxymethylenebutenolidase
MNTLTKFIAVVGLMVGCAHARAAEDKPKAGAAGAASLPPAEAEAKARLDKSTRHGEFVEIAVPGAKVPVKSFVVYPERKEKAPVVIVIHEIFGLSDWVRSVADQLAADGYIAIAPDLLSGMGPNGGGTDAVGKDDVRKLIMGLKDDDVVAKLNAVRDYGMKLPASNGKTATVGFCWGGKASFMYATRQPEVNAAVVYYGTSPDSPDAYKQIKAPVLGLYGGDDARVNKTIDAAKEGMKQNGKTYLPHVYDGAGHAFLRQQDGQNGANMKAAQQAWPETIEFIKDNCE